MSATRSDRTADGGRPLTKTEIKRREDARAAIRERNRRDAAGGDR